MIKGSMSKCFEIRKAIETYSRNPTPPNAELPLIFASCYVPYYFF